MDISNLINDFITADAWMLKLILGSVFGLCLGLTGVGGGVLLIPMLQMFCDMSAVLAVGTASLISALVKINASYCHIKAKNVSWQVVKWLFVGAVPLTLIVTQMVIYFDGHPSYSAATQTSVSLLVKAVMIGSLITVVRKFVAKPPASSDELAKPATSTKAVVSGMFCGSILGASGVGGGVLLLPVLNSVLSIDIRRAVGSSVVLALSLSCIAALGYAKGGQADVTTALWFVCGSFAGVALASRLMRKISDRLIYLLTIVVIMCSLCLYLFA